jgi:hypothetical protein
MQYRYKSARKIIKRTYKFMRVFSEIYNDEDDLITELRKKIIITTPEELNANCQKVISQMYEVLNTPNRYK